MTSPESIVVGVVAGSNLDCTSAERGIYKFCVGDYWNHDTREKGMEDTCIVEVLTRIGISNCRVQTDDQTGKERTPALYLSSSGWTATARSPGIVSGLVVETTISPLPSSNGKANE